MDIHEIIAKDLEFAQQKRLKKNGYKDSFFERGTVEDKIHGFIQWQREQSNTYHPDNHR